MTGIQASMDSKSDFWKTLCWIAYHYREDAMVLDGGSIFTTEGELGIDGPHNDPETDGEYIDVGFVLPDDIYAVIDDGTYGTLNAFRIYKEPQ